MVDADTVTFGLLSLVLLGTALAVVLSKKLMNAALWLAASLVGVAVVFLTLRAEFLFVIQILVYVGAIVTLIVFGIMFTHGSAREDP